MNILRFVSFLVILILLVSLIGCHNKKTEPILVLKSIDLLSGDVVSCGGDQFGQLSFYFSCKNSNRKAFNLAVSLLHSFEYEEAEKAFAKVIDEDPDCAMAYWGVAMCNFHALWRPPTIRDLEKGSLAIKIARSIQGKSDREKAYIEAIASFYTGWENLGHFTRIKKFEDAMKNIYNKYPDDDEAAIFYALALNSAADLSDKTFKNQRKAGLILEQLFPDQPNHPGIAHYIIHSYDNPELADLALSASRSYASIAPASSHAQHMPSHIFTRLGLWEESILSNLNATSSAQCYAEQVGMEGNWDEEIHGTDYLVYAYLQTGQITEAKKFVEYLRSIKKINPIGVKAAYPTAAIPARFYLETRQWEKAATLEMSSRDFPTEKYPWPNAIVHFARVLGAVHLGNLSEANIDLKKIIRCHDHLLKEDDEYMANQVLIMVKAAEAWIKIFDGNENQALMLMTSSVNLENSTDKQALTPGEVLPSQELLGDLFMKLNNPTEALKTYEVNLKIRPNRFNSIYGAALASKKMGDKKKAGVYFKMLLSLAESSDRSEIKEARKFISKI